MQTAGFPADKPGTMWQQNCTDTDPVDYDYGYFFVECWVFYGQSGACPSAGHMGALHVCRACDGLLHKSLMAQNQHMHCGSEHGGTLGRLSHSDSC